MKIKIAENSGFCPGVRRADIAVNNLVANPNNRTFTLGELIHNRLYTESLKKLGVVAVTEEVLVKELYAAPDIPTNLVIRTHGVTKECSARLEELRVRFPLLNIIDMTCPFVKNIHKIAESTTNQTTHFLLFCDKNHPEAVGIMSYANGEKTAFSSEEELATINFEGKIPILCSQTTQNLLEFEKIKKNLKKLCTNAKIYDTICSVTENRQNDAIKLAKECDLMIVIGGRNSANTRKLYDLCSEACPSALWIESAEDLTDFSDNAKSVGITAGASTPDGIITEVLELWKKKT